MTPLEVLDKFKYALIIVGVMIVITIISCCVRKKKGTTDILNPKSINDVQNILNQIRQMHLLSIQDSNPIVALMHSTSALSYYQLLSGTILASLSPVDIQKLTDTNFSELHTYLRNAQQAAIVSFEKHIPELSNAARKVD